jgi:hypothetical protein
LRAEYVVTGESDVDKGGVGWSECELRDRTVGDAQREARENADQLLSLFVFRSAVP